MEIRDHTPQHPKYLVQVSRSAPQNRRQLLHIPPPRFKLPPPRFRAQPPIKLVIRQQLPHRSGERLCVRLVHRHAPAARRQFPQYSIRAAHTRTPPSQTFHNRQPKPLRQRRENRERTLIIRRQQHLVIHMLPPLHRPSRSPQPSPISASTHLPNGVVRPASTNSNFTPPCQTRSAAASNFK